MPNLHDIQRRINSVTSTKQITRTMEMVAAAKIRGASARVDAATPYAESMAEMLANVADSAGSSDNPLLQEHSETKRMLLIAVVSDRGLAGGFNSEVLRTVEKLVRANASAGIDTSVIACGKKAISYFEFRNIALEMVFKDLSADPTIEEAHSIANRAVSGYTAGDFDKVVIVYNHAKNAAEQVLRQEVILPIDAQSLAAETSEAAKAAAAALVSNEESGEIAGDIIFEPSASGVLDQLLPAYVNTMIYHALIDSAAGEQGARRNAMKSATDNANEMVETLERYYNRVRQGAITTEINEIVGGAAALED